MLRTFNCGVGMIVVADAAHDHEAEEALHASGEAPVRLGEVVAAPEGERVRFSGKLAL
jgi:phosphoribosylformylglycinamidine cyclo-ligase